MALSAFAETDRLWAEILVWRHRIADAVLANHDLPPDEHVAVPVIPAELSEAMTRAAKYRDENLDMTLTDAEKTERSAKHDAEEDALWEKKPPTKWRCDACDATWKMPGRGGLHPACCDEQTPRCFITPRNAWMSVEELLAELAAKGSVRYDDDAGRFVVDPPKSKVA